MLFSAVCWVLSGCDVVPRHRGPDAESCKCDTAQSMAYKQLQLDAVRRSQAAFNQGDIKTACSENDLADEYGAKANDVGGIVILELARRDAELSSQLRTAKGC